MHNATRLNNAWWRCVKSGQRNPPVAMCLHRTCQGSFESRGGWLPAVPSQPQNVQSKFRKSRVRVDPREVRSLGNEKAPPKWGRAELHGVSGSFWLLPLRRRVRRLFQRGVDRVEGGSEFATDAIDRSDDHKRDAGRDQAVFDGGSAGLVGAELLENGLQLCLPLGVVWRGPTTLT
jgi:hypothetical protein